MSFLSTTYLNLMFVVLWILPCIQVILPLTPCVQKSTDHRSWKKLISESSAMQYIRLKNGRSKLKVNITYDKWYNGSFQSPNSVRKPFFEDSTKSLLLIWRERVINDAIDSTTKMSQRTSHGCKNNSFILLSKCVSRSR